MRLLDVGIGLLLPLWLLGLERILFGGSGLLGWPSGGSLFDVWRPAVYAGTSGFVLALAAWLVLGRAAGFLSGVLAAGVVFAATVGVCLLPLSVLGLFAGIGLLGLTPFLMVWVYSRCARDAWRASRHRRLAAPVFGFLLALALPAGAQVVVRRTIARALVLVEAADPVERRRGIERLCSLRLVFDADDLLQAYHRTEDPVLRQRLDEAFEALTGWTIENWQNTAD